MGHSQREAPDPRQTSRFSAQLKMFLVQLVSQRPLIFWGSVWAIALMLISGSISTLLDPSASQRVSLHELFPPPQPIAAPSPTASDAVTTAVSPAVSPNGVLTSPSSPVPSPAAPPVIVAEQPTLPYRSLGAIVLGCGLGSILISQLMNRSPQPQRLRSAAPAAQRPPAAKPPVRSTPPHSTLPPLPQPASPSPQPASTPAAYQMPPALTTARSKPRSTAEPPAPPAVTVVPAEASHPLDWDKNSLVNAMDIRKRRSLSSWM